MVQFLNRYNISKNDFEALCWCVADVVCFPIGGYAPSTAKAVQTARLLCRYVEGGQAILKNPHFMRQEIDRPSPVTIRYLKTRAAKTIGTAAAILCGRIAGVATGVNLPGIALGVSNIASTGLHLARLQPDPNAPQPRPIGINFRRGAGTSEWIDLLEKVKLAKLLVQTAGTAGAAVPFLPAAIIARIGMTAITLGINITLGHVLSRTAMDIHWCAYQDLAASGAFGRDDCPPSPQWSRPYFGNGWSAPPGGRVGPSGEASRIFFEIFTRRGATSVFGAYDVAQLIREPAGWMALDDKIKLL